jgi:multiple sugar transport system ATP-binding protein
MSVALTLDKLKKTFVQNGREITAVDELSLQIQPGEFFTFVGPSGCGKTTTLRMIAGLEHSTSGRILFDGRDVTSLPTQKRDIGMVFQDIALFPYMSIRQNIAYPLKVAGVAKVEIDKRVEATAELLSISDKLNMKPGQLSGGQQQRVAIGRAIVKEPKILLLDEPLSALDARLRTEMRSEILRLHRRIKATIIYVTHDQVEAMTMSTRLAVMERGQAAQVAAPRDVFRTPISENVATFIGTPAMNVWDADLVQDEKGASLVGAGMTLPLARSDAATLGSVRRVRVGVRPPAMLLTGRGEGLADGTLYLREPLGLEDECHIRMPDGTEVKCVGRVPDSVA